MKKARNIQILTIVLLTLSLSFVSCNNKKKKVITPLAIAEEINVIPTYREAIVFITGVDDSESSFYENAKMIFEEKKYEVITEAFSLQEIILWLNNNFDERLYTDIHIVSKNNTWNGMGLETSINGKGIKANTLRNDLINGKIPKLQKGITKNTNIIFHVSELGNDADLIRSFKSVFTTTSSPKITTTSYITIFGGDFSDHHLAKPYYVFYPTAHSPGKVDLSKEIAKKYSNEKELDWYTALTNYSERYIGDAYTIQYNVPVQWELDFADTDNEMPTFNNSEEIMDWIEQNQELSKEFSTLNIPVDKFRWTAASTKGKLVIKGVTTVLCVLKPLIMPYGDLQHIAPEIDNLRLYSIE